MTRLHARHTGTYTAAEEKRPSVAAVVRRRRFCHNGVHRKSRFYLIFTAHRQWPSRARAATSMTTGFCGPPA